MLQAMLEISLFVITIISLAIGIVNFGMHVVKQIELPKQLVALSAVHSAKERELTDKFKNLDAVVRRLVTEHNNNVMSTRALADIPSSDLPQV